LLIVEKFNY